MPILRIVQEAPCFPVTLAEARMHLAVDASDRSVDSLIEMLIASATSDAENRLVVYGLSLFGIGFLIN